MHIKKSKPKSPLEKELAQLEKQEEKLRNAALKVKPPQWKSSLEAKIPAKVYTGLESAFCKSFAVVFSQGRNVIEKSYNKENVKADHSIRDYALRVKGGRKEFRSMRKSAGRSDSVNMALTTVEGIALGALGIGMPDVLLFLSTVLKGVYETALNYGFDYTSKYEQLLILKMMQTSLSSSEDWGRLDRQVDELFGSENCVISEHDFDAQINATASCFAIDMLLLKFVQGLPIVGIIGGAANPVYYNKILKYINLKYRKHYLLKLKADK